MAVSLLTATFDKAVEAFCGDNATSTGSKKSLVDSGYDDSSDTLSPCRKKLRSDAASQKHRAMLVQARSLFAQGSQPNCEAALGLCNRITSENPDFTEALQLLIDCHEAKGDSSAALDLVKRTLERPSQSKLNLALWNELRLKFADRLKLAEESLVACRALVALDCVPDEEKCCYLEHLIETLKDDIKYETETMDYQLQLIGVAAKVPNKSETILRTSIELAEKYLDLQKPDRSLSLLADHVEFILQNSSENLGSATRIQAICVWTIAMVLGNQAETCWNLMHHHGLVEKSVDGLVIQFSFDDGNGEGMYRNGLITAVCICYLKAESPPKSSRAVNSLKELIKNTLLKRQKFGFSKVYMELADILFTQCGEAELAHDLLLHVQLLIPDFRSVESCNLLGNIYESLKDCPRAMAAYRASNEIRRNRVARTRIHYLDEGEFPNFQHFVGTTAEEEREIKHQLTLFAQYLQSARTKLVDRAKEFVESTFISASPPASNDFLWKLKTPYAMDNATKKKRVNCLCLTSAQSQLTITLGTWFNVAYTGCAQAFLLKRYQDMVDIAFRGLLTAEIYSDQSKVDCLKMAIAVAAYYLPLDSSTETTSQVTTRKVFFFDFIREWINRSKTVTLPVAFWNAFYALIMDPSVYPELKVGKWGNFFRKKNGFCLPVNMILAQDVLRRKGGYRHAYQLYDEIKDCIGSGDVPWYIYLHLGVLAVNMAAGRSGLRKITRVRYYNMGISYLEQYGRLRGTCPEVSWNKARAAHLFNDQDTAIRFYLECLDLCGRTTFVGTVVTSAGIALETDFTYYAAFNLRQLFISRGQFVELEKLSAGALSWKAIRKILH